MSKVRVIAIDDHPRRAARMSFDIDFSSAEITDLNVEGVSQDYAAVQLRDISEAPAVHFPWQQSYPTAEPMRVPKYLAWHLISRGWRLEGALADIVPPRPSPLPEGAIA